MLASGISRTPGIVPGSAIVWRTFFARFVVGLPLADAAALSRHPVFFRLRSAEELKANSVLPMWSKVF